MRHQEIADAIGCSRVYVTLQLRGHRALTAEVVRVAEGLLAASGAATLRACITSQARRVIVAGEERART